MEFTSKYMCTNLSLRMASYFRDSKPKKRSLKIYVQRKMGEGLPFVSKN